MLPDIEALFRRIAKLQLEPASANHSGLTGTQRAELVVSTIESYITMARHANHRIDVERSSGER